MTLLTPSLLDQFPYARMLLRRMSDLWQTVDDSDINAETEEEQSEQDVHIIHELAACGWLTPHYTYCAWTLTKPSVDGHPIAWRMVTIYHLTDAGRQAINAYDEHACAERNHFGMSSNHRHNPRFQFGKSTINVESEDFEAGYDSGFCDLDVLSPVVAESTLYEFLKEVINDNQEHTPGWNTGYVIGALHSLYVGIPEPGERFGEVVTLSPHHRLLLNEWHFTEGYAIGQQDYQLAQDDSLAGLGATLTARDLLAYIAVRDGNTGRYLPPHDLLHALECSVGRFVGYLCAALFPREAPHSEQLHATPESIYVRQSIAPVARPIVAEEA